MGSGLAVAALVLAILILPVAGWLWLCLGVLKSGIRSVFGAVAIQLSLVAIVFGLLIGSPLGALIVALAPPLVLFSPFNFLQFGLFFSMVLPIALSCGAIVLGIFLSLPGLRLWSVAPALLAVLSTGIVVGEHVSKREMCRTAEASGIVEFRRRTLLWSLQNVPEEFQFDIHAAAEVGGRRMGWSYREMGWYEIPAEAWGEVDGPYFDCAGWIGTQVESLKPQRFAQIMDQVVGRVV